MLLLLVLVMLPMMPVPVPVPVAMAVTVRLPVVADRSQPWLRAAVSFVLHRGGMVLVFYRRPLQVSHNGLQLLPKLILDGCVVFIVLVPDLNNIFFWLHTYHDSNKVWLCESFAHACQDQFLPAFRKAYAWMMIVLLKPNDPSSPIRESFPHWHVSFPKDMVSSRLLHLIRTTQLRVQFPKLFNSAKAPQIFQMVKVCRCFHD
mmetsp:Transcript_6623/g.15172  ORF Transcript_6623/g.15172 Transcript_6623/m.15172 type:complete len:203 (+) Transcript_6623:352-960(+)